jgi:hypothetical protein
MSAATQKPVANKSQTRFDNLRALGRRKFIGIYGMLGWGVPTALLFALAICSAEGFRQFVPTLEVSMFIFPVAGIFWGAAMWEVCDWLSGRVLSAAAAE